MEQELTVQQVNLHAYSVDYLNFAFCSAYSSVHYLEYVSFFVGNHCLAVLKESEGYASMSAGLSDLRKEPSKA